jgi:hypothetical protein
VRPARLRDAGIDRERSTANGNELLRRCCALGSSLVSAKGARGNAPASSRAAARPSSPSRHRSAGTSGWVSGIACLTSTT